MGCQGSKPGAGQPSLPKTGAGAAPGGVQRPAAAAKKALNRKDYIISNKIGEVIVKQEGSINGEQFNIEECKNCDIFLLDHIASAFIDECTDCRIFVGPVESSVMVRNCRGCDFVIACQQFRSRDCANCRLALFCTTEPIIETSSNMRFACFDFCYFSLRQHLAKAGLKLWNNKWWQIYDFNKNPDRPNWSLLPQEEAPRLLRTELCAGSVPAEELAMDRVVPITLGSRPWPSKVSCLILFLPDSEASLEAFLAKADKTEGWTLCRTRSMVLGEEQLKTLLGFTKDPRLISRCKGRETAAIEICGDNVALQAPEALATVGIAASSKSVRIVPESETAALSKAFFEVWKDEV